MYDVRSILKDIEFCFSLVGLLLNMFEFYLITYHTTATVKPYKPILYQNCVTDCIYIVAVLTTRIQADIRSKTLFYLVNIPFLKTESPQIVMMASIFWVFSLTFYVLAVPVQFVYRYIQVRRFDNVPKIVHALMLFISFSCSCFLSFHYYMVFRNSHQIETESIAILSADPAYLNGIGGMMSTKIEGFWFFVYHGLSICFTTLSSIVIGISSLRFWQYTRQNRVQITAATREAMKQMTIILTIQAAAPFVVCFVPIITFLIHALFLDNTSIVPLMIIPAISLFPIANAEGLQSFERL
uniref:G-protein coupled receptors family 1 profile domain-containing protein n=1 Tax=Panagrellus redivivus TaxID=6233 RepID=A0A7E4VXD4_PANRE